MKKSKQPFTLFSTELLLAWDWANSRLVYYDFSYVPKVNVGIVFKLTVDSNEKDRKKIDVNAMQVSPTLVPVELTVLKEVVTHLFGKMELKASVEFPQKECKAQFLF